MEKITKFSKETCEHLGYYVYKLIDPRNGQVFYVGKGNNDRVFDHVNGKIKNEEKEKEENEDSKISLKEEIIGQIKAAGLEVIYIIHRHGMDEDTAFIVESVLIDEYPDLANRQKGHNSEYGIASAVELEDRYKKEEITEFKKEDEILVIKIKQETLAANYGNVYETVRKWWRIGGKRKNVKYVVAVKNGVVNGVFKVEKWEKYSDIMSNINDEEESAEWNNIQNRYCFVGEEVKKSEYLDKRIPAKFMKKGMSSPVLYANNITDDK